ncbi:hypothetical protein L1049_002728 [Liquidambar formosana]|uniref:CASP-like protein n=1 Tax=Liquidambar formosana TaxID=63359 RepID=A0AAP0NFJ0_LIQFO
METHQEEEEGEKQTTPNTPSTMDSSPPRSHRDRRSLSPPVHSPVYSTVSSDRFSHEFFSPREDRDPIPQPETTPSAMTPSPDILVDQSESGRPGVVVDSPDNSTVSSDRFFHGFFSPREGRDPIPQPEPTPSAMPLAPDIVVNRSVSSQPGVVVMEMDPRAGSAFAGGVVDGGGRKTRPSLSILRRPRREMMVKRMALGFRFIGSLFCMISFSVMAADRNKGWALDSFDRYKEFRYCLSVNIIAFAYSGVQACDLAFHLTTHFHRHNLRYYFDFFMDQILTYLLISASSSAATRVEDWQSNWGKDKFPQMASASVAMSFLAFVALASSSLISGYTICTLKST